MLSRALHVLLLSLVLLLTGCSDDGPSGPSSPAGGSSSSPGSPSASASGGAEAPDASPSAAPATGKRVETRSVAYHLPEGVTWKLDRGGQSASYRDDAGNRWSVQHIDDALQAGASGSVDEDWAVSKDTIVNPGGSWRRAENRVVNGVEGWAASSVNKTFDELVYAFGGVHDRMSTTLTFVGPRKDPRTREWIEAVLASIEWK